ncbi:MAG TPA: hypothetical protein VKD65_15235 [Candidatus Angelobacter sp.]|nr:hypothetical protein [Candidatus Angelobacter sp.]
MKKALVMGWGLCLMFLATMSFGATRQQAQSGSMQDDSMKKDKMSHKMTKPEELKGWVTDSECAAHGEKKCGDKKHVAQGAKLVIVTDGDNKIWTVANPEKVAEHQGHYVLVKATKDAETGTVNVQNVKMLKEAK